MTFSKEQTRGLVEAMLFASDRPVSLQQILNKIRQVVRRNVGAILCNRPEVGANHYLPLPGQNLTDTVETQLLQKQKELEEEIDREDIKTILAEIQNNYEKNTHGFELVQVAGGYQFRTKPEMTSYLKEEKKSLPIRLSVSSMEALAVVAYKQPVSRGEIEEIRGVDCGAVLKTLLDRELIRLIGRSEDPGRPLVYGTTQKFLEIFSLNTLKDLPDPSEFPEFAEDEISVSREGQRDTFITSEDFTDVTEEYDETERALLSELQGSLDEVKDVEKSIEFFQKKSE